MRVSSEASNIRSGVIKSLCLIGFFQLSVEGVAPVSYPKYEDLDTSIHIEHIPKVVKCPILPSLLVHFNNLMDILY